MKARNTATSWGWVARLFHWGMAGLILFQLGLGLWMTAFTPDLIARFRLTQLHKSWGVVVFALALARVAWRLANRTSPGPPEGEPAWRAGAARASHALLYALMLVLPLSGWVAAAASPVQDLLGMENMAFGAVALPDPWKPGVEALADAAASVHFWGAVLLAAVLAVHAGAALWGHFGARDDVLARMTWGA